MKVKILNFSTYKAIVDDSSIDQLIGTQCIYPINLQEPLIQTFDSDTDGLIHYCLNVKNVFLFPKYTHSDINISNDYIFVSDEFYDKYFSNDLDDHELHFYYDIPLIKQIRLKRIDGDFPSDDSIKFLLNDYLESCSVLNLNQTFKLDYLTNYIVFSIDQIIYRTEFEKDLKKRMEEINYMIELNTNIANSFNLKPPRGMLECESNVVNYQFYYHSIGKEVASLGYVANYGAENEVEIDFVVSSTSTDSDTTKAPQIAPFTFSTKTNADPTQPIESINPTDTAPVELSKEEIRKRRTAYFEKMMNKQT